MIDYEKLKIAHELAHTYAFNGKEITSVLASTRLVSSNVIEYLIEFYGNEKYQEFASTNIDDIIGKLTELTQPNEPKPKYEVGQEVWVIGNHQIPEQCIVTKIHPSSKPFLYSLKNDDEKEFVEQEGLISSSRELLIQSQIEYWKSLSAISDGYTPVICQHESDGFWVDAATNHLKFRCKKCGEFYR
jgi:hypothetical protein